MTDKHLRKSNTIEKTGSQSGTNRKESMLKTISDYMISSANRKITTTQMVKRISKDGSINRRTTLHDKGNYLKAFQENKDNLKNAIEKEKILK